jgi:lauroyl/myristoyl acyltransferase
MPEQYYWVHKRFKTQPNDAERVYDWTLKSQT